MLDAIAQGESSTVLPTLQDTYRTYGVNEYCSHKVTEITYDEVICKTASDETVRIPCDYVVMAVGAKPVPFDTDLLEEKGIPVYRIGDCLEKASDISNAIRTAYDTANSL